MVAIYRLTSTVSKSCRVICDCSMKTVKDRGMRRESDFKRSGRPAVRVCPQVAQSVSWSRETEIAPGVTNCVCGIADVEDCEVRVPAGVSAGLGPRGPNHNVVSGDNR